MTWHANALQRKEIEADGSWNLVVTAAGLQRLGFASLLQTLM